MEPIALIVVCWLLFGGTHVGLATGPVRTALVARLGDGGFRLLYFAIAAVAFTVLVRTYALHAHEGPLGFGGFVGPTLRLVLWAIAGLGATLMVAGLVAYPESPMELATRGVPPPTRLAHITRHAFFVGLAIVASVHVVLATHLTGTVFFAGLVLLDVVGAWHQDRKLLATKGDAYAAYCRETSIVPFAAIVAGRARMTARDVPVIPLAIGVVGAAAIRWVHPHLFAWDGMAVVAAVVGGAVFLATTSLVRLAVRAGHGRALATAGGMLVLEVGLAHEMIGTRLYPDGPALLGGPLGWHAIGVAGIAMGLCMTGGALGLTAMPPRVLATGAIVLGLGFLALDAVLHGGFHFFAATLVVGAWLVRSAGAFDAVTSPLGAAASRRPI
jgi:uncharacterized membrane protein